MAPFVLYDTNETLRWYVGLSTIVSQRETPTMPLECINHVVKRSEHLHCLLVPANLVLFISGLELPSSRASPSFGSGIVRGFRHGCGSEVQLGLDIFA